MGFPHKGPSPLCSEPFIIYSENDLLSSLTILKLGMQRFPLILSPISEFNPSVAEGNGLILLTRTVETEGKKTTG